MLQPFRNPGQIVTPVYGVPGAGKTHFLIGIIEKLLDQGTAPERIVYCSFTKAAAYSGLDRIAKKTDIDPKAFTLARTVHSLSLKAAGRTISRKEIMNSSDYKTVASSVGAEVTKTADFSADFPLRDTQLAGRDGDFCLWVYTLLRAKMLDPTDIHAVPSIVEDMTRFRGFPGLYFNFLEALEEYKAETAKLDFSDMLELGRQGNPFDVDAAVIDEAQDLSALQWAALDTMLGNCPKIWVAGDDDQAIYDFSGGSSEVFRAMGELPTIVKLEKSRRCPRHVMRVADEALRYIGTRVPKHAEPQERDGKATVVVDLLDIDFTEGEWMILVRQHAHAKDIYQHLRMLGLQHRTTKHGESIRQSEKDLIRAHSALCAGRGIPAGNVPSYMKALSRSLVAHGYKNKAADTVRRLGLGTITPELLVASFGLQKKALYLPWFEVFDKLPAETVEFIRRTLESGDFYKDRRIEVSTVHGAKGREAENVVIVDFQGYRQKKSMEKGEEDEYRVAYVAMTRALNALYLLSPLEGTNPPTSYRRFFRE